MNDRIKRDRDGTGLYNLSKKAAGEIYRAAKNYKLKDDITTWKRPKKKASQ